MLYLQSKGCSLGGLGHPRKGVVNVKFTLTEVLLLGNFVVLLLDLIRHW
jgi:hypothetical protein